MKMTMRQKIAVACVVLVLGATIGWVTAQIPPPKQVAVAVEPEIQITYVNLSDEAWAKLEDFINGW